MIGSVEALDLKAGELVAKRTFSRAHDLWIEDHKPLKLLKHPLVSGIMAVEIALFGVYSVENSIFNVGVTVLFGGIGVVMRIYGYPPAPLVLALVLGPMLEKALRQSLQMSLGSMEIFVTRPVSAGILAVALIAVVYPLASSWRGSRRRGATAAA